MLAVNRGEEPDADVKAFVDDLNLPYTVLVRGLDLFRGPYKGKFIPHTYVLDQTGTVRYSHVGFDGPQSKSWLELIKTIDELLVKG